MWVNRRRNCVELESMNAEGTWYEGTWNDWRWRTPDHWSSSISSTPHTYSWTWHNWERHSPWSNQGSPQWNLPFDTHWNLPVDTQWNSLVDTMSNDSRQYGDGEGEVIPSFDGTEFRQYDRPLPLCVWLQREGLVNLWKDVHLILVKEYTTWKHRMVLRICLII